MFVYISITLGDYTPSVAPFYVTSKVSEASTSLASHYLRITYIHCLLIPQFELTHDSKNHLFDAASFFFLILFVFLLHRSLALWAVTGRYSFPNSVTISFPHYVRYRFLCT